MAVIALPTRIPRVNTRWIGRLCLWYVNRRGVVSGIRYLHMRQASAVGGPLPGSDGGVTLCGLEGLGGVPQLVRLFNAAYVGAPDYQRAGWIECLALQASRSYDPAMVWIARQDGVPVGFCMARLNGEEGRVTGLGVLPSHRRRGIGARLMRRATDELRGRGATEITLSVAASNHASVRLYRRLGFQPEA